MYDVGYGVVAEPSVVKGVRCGVWGSGIPYGRINMREATRTRVTPGQVHKINSHV